MRPSDPLVMRHNGSLVYPTGLRCGALAYLIGGGDVSEFDLRTAQASGAILMGMNAHHPGAAMDYRVCVDPLPDDSAFWSDASMPFVPKCRMGAYSHMAHAVFYQTSFCGCDPCSFLMGGVDVGDWPEPDDYGVRSVMFPALRLLHWLGARNVGLLGVSMRGPTPDSGPDYYQRVGAKLARLAPAFQSVGFHVFNCTPNSTLTAFPTASIYEVAERALWSDAA